MSACGERVCMRLHRSAVLFALSLFLAALACARADPLVYIIEKSGKKYHQRHCRLKQGSHGVKLSVAKKRGFQPCKVCKPPK